MLELGKPIHTYDADGVAISSDGRRRLIVRRAEAGRADRDARPRRARPRHRHAPDHRRPRPGRHRRRHGRRAVRGQGHDDGRDRRVGDLRSGHHSPDRPALRASGARPASASRRARSSGSPASARTGPRGSSPSGPAGPSLPAASTQHPDEPEPASVAFRPARVNRLLGTDVPAEEQRELLARVGVETEPASGPVEIPLSAGPKPLTLTVDADGTAGALVAIVPDLAPRHRDRGRRRRGGRSRPWLRADPEHPARHADAGRTATRPWRSATQIRETLAGAGLTEVVTHALVAPRLAEAFRWERAAPDRRGRVTRRRSPDRRDEPALGRSLGASSGARRQPRPGRLDEPAPRRRRRRDLRDRQGLRRRDRRRRSSGGGSASRRPARAIRRRSTARPDRTTSTTPRARSSCSRAAWASTSRPTAPSEASRCSTRAERRGSSRSATVDLVLAGVVGELHPAVVDAWDLRGARVVVAELDLTGLGGGLRTRRDRGGAASPSGQRSRPCRRRRRRRRRGRCRRSDPRERRARPSPSLQLFDVYRGSPLASNEKSLAFRLTFQAPDRALDEAEIDTAIAAITSGLSAQVGGRIRT